MSGFEMRLKDGAIARVDLTVSIPDGGTDTDRQVSDLENFLGGGLAGFAANIVSCQVIVAFPSEQKGVQKR